MIKPCPNPGCHFTTSSPRALKNHGRSLCPHTIVPCPFYGMNKRLCSKGSMPVKDLRPHVLSYPWVVAAERKSADLHAFTLRTESADRAAAPVYAGLVGDALVVLQGCPADATLRLWPYDVGLKARRKARVTMGAAVGAETWSASLPLASAGKRREEVMGEEGATLSVPRAALARARRGLETGQGAEILVVVKIEEEVKEEQYILPD